MKVDLYNKKTPPIYRDELFIRGTTMLRCLHNLSRVTIITLPL